MISALGFRFLCFSDTRRKRTLRNSILSLHINCFSLSVFDILLEFLDVLLHNVALGFQYSMFKTSCVFCVYSSSSYTTTSFWFEIPSCVSCWLVLACLCNQTEIEL
uniref:Uncharacterized protein n=1 Tax=Cacopsylla melanoneura TaxID=428564 RepID=A0A8D8ZRX1_9HEMI